MPGASHIMGACAYVGLLHEIIAPVKKDAGCLLVCSILKGSRKPVAVVYKDQKVSQPLFCSLLSVLDS